MSRILILIPFLLWLTWADNAWPPKVQAVPGLAAFFGIYAVQVLVLGIWGRWLANRVTAQNFSRSVRRFNFTITAARFLIPAWYAVGVYILGWGAAVERLLGNRSLCETLPGVVLGTLPAFAAWMGLWWAQFPADRALREQGVRSQLESDLPVHAPPSFGKYFQTNLRLQILFMGAPVLLIVLIHDIGKLLLRQTALQGQAYDNAEVVVWLMAAGAVFFVAPEILRRILHTEPLAEGALRARLDALCRRYGVRYRDILLWKTEYNMGNAAVMGFVPRLRYILMSDLLLETMTDEQIEAVFAHELGHVVHRHMSWYVVFMVVLVLLNVAAQQWIEKEWGPQAKMSQQALMSLVALGKFLILFGFVSRRFERQADVFAARTMESTRQEFAEDDLSAVASTHAVDGTLMLEPASRTESHVGQYGAAVFSSALHRVAIINNIPIAARSWCHGSIAKRMHYLQTLSRDPGMTAQFDRFMVCLYASLLLALGISATLFVLSM